MSITVRYAERTELDRVNELRQMVNALHAAGRPDIFRPDFCEELRQSVYRAQEAPDADVIVACLDGVVCGFAVVQYMDRPASAYQCARRYYHIEEFGVDAAFRRRGVGADEGHVAKRRGTGMVVHDRHVGATLEHGLRAVEARSHRQVDHDEQVGRAGVVARAHEAVRPREEAVQARHGGVIGQKARDVLALPVLRDDPLERKAAAEGVAVGVGVRTDDDLGRLVDEARYAPELLTLLGK